MITYREYCRQLNEGASAVPPVLYRCESYSGSGVRVPREVLLFEMGELTNTDVIDYCLENYGDKMRPEAKTLLANAIEPISEGDMDEKDIEKVVDTLLAELERIWGIRIASVLWLAEYDTVKDMYDGEDGEISEYPTTKYILSDLGYDGILFAYPK